ncbi:MAG TPA: alpha/beta hydrolase [Ramlibacter sp.]
MPQQEITLPMPWGSLGGSLLLPEGPGPFTVALVVAGAGPTDRDGNNPQLPVRYDNLLLLAQALAERGMASLRYDKRGVGASPVPGLGEDALRFDHLVDDAEALALHLLADARFNDLVLVGHSEGALVAALVAGRVPAAALACLAGAAERASTLMREQIQRVMPPDLSLAATAALDALDAELPAEDVADELALLFRPSVQPYLISWFRHHPAQVLAALDVPVLLVHGGADAQVPVAHAERLRAARPDARLRIVDGMDHLLAVGGDMRPGVRAVAEEMRAWLDVPAPATSAAP